LRLATIAARSLFGEDDEAPARFAKQIVGPIEAEGVTRHPGDSRRRIAIRPLSSVASAPKKNQMSMALIKKQFVPCI
jgi:hypothetical protein